MRAHIVPLRQVLQGLGCDTSPGNQGANFHHTRKPWHRKIPPHPNIIEKKTTSPPEKHQKNASPTGITSAHHQKHQARAQCVHRVAASARGILAARQKLGEHWRKASSASCNSGVNILPPHVHICGPGLQHHRGKPGLLSPRSIATANHPARHRPARSPAAIQAGKTRRLPRNGDTSGMTEGRDTDCINQSSNSSSSDGIWPSSLNMGGQQRVRCDIGAAC